MGVFKDQLVEEEEKRAFALIIALEAKAIKECPVHPGTYINRYDPDAVELAYRIANSRFSKGEISVCDFEDRREMTDMIKKVIEDSCYECPGCAKLESE